MSTRTQDTVLYWAPAVVRPKGREKPPCDLECRWCGLLVLGYPGVRCGCGGPTRAAVFNEPRQKRVGLGLSRERVAEMTGLSLATVCAVESGWTGLIGDEWHADRFTARILAALGEYEAAEKPRRRKRKRGWAR